MGTMRFRVFPTERITAELVQRAYLTGIDRVSWPVRASTEKGELILQRSVADSANLHVPWTVEGHGPLTLVTGSLIERSEPYHLPLELARGTIVQVRNQLAEWQMIGLTVPGAATANLAKAVERFSWAAVEQGDEAVSAARAEEALQAALQASDLLAAAFSEQAMAARHRNEGNQFALLGADLGIALLDDFTSRHFLHSFNAAEVPISWRETEVTEGNFTWVFNDLQIEWCRAHGLKVLAGPLLVLDPRALPDWLLLFEDDFESVMDFASAYVKAAVKRYSDKVDYWICAARVNDAEVLALSEQERLQLAARTIELIRSLDYETPVLMSFDQPWAEYMRQQNTDFPPLHFADTLVRAGLDLAGLMLEMNVGYHPGGTLPRSPLEFSRQLDAWSKLGLPLWLSLSAPGSHGDDPLAFRKVSLPAGSWTLATQQAWAARFVPLALAKPMVQGVIWNQLRDNQPHDFPHGGLFDANGRAKPALHTLARIRRKHLR
jgi:hypothetical protein